MRKISIHTLCMLLCGVILLAACVPAACAEAIPDGVLQIVSEDIKEMISEAGSKITLYDFPHPDTAANELSQNSDMSTMLNDKKEDGIYFVVAATWKDGKVLETYGCPVFKAENSDGETLLFFISEAITDDYDELTVFLTKKDSISSVKHVKRLFDAVDIFYLGTVKSGASINSYRTAEVKDGESVQLVTVTNITEERIELAAVNGKAVDDSDSFGFKFDGEIPDLIFACGVENSNGELIAVLVEYQDGYVFIRADEICNAVAPAQSGTKPTTAPTTPTETEETVEPTPPIGEPKDDMQKYYIIGGAAAAVIVLWLLMKKKKQEQSAPASTPAPSPAPAPVPPMPPMPPVNGSGETTQYPVTEPNKSNLMLAARGGALDGGIYPIQPVMKFGRLPDNNIRFPADTSGVSRHHAELRTQGTRMILMDCGSTSGTYVKRIGKLTPQQPAEVFADDIIYIGSEKNSFIIKKM